MTWNCGERNKWIKLKFKTKQSSQLIGATVCECVCWILASPFRRSLHALHTYIIELWPTVIRTHTLRLFMITKPNWIKLLRLLQPLFSIVFTFSTFSYLYSDSFLAASCTGPFLSLSCFHQGLKHNLVQIIELIAKREKQIRCQKLKKHCFLRLLPV